MFGELTPSSSSAAASVVTSAISTLRAYSRGKLLKKIVEVYTFDKQATDKCATHASFCVAHFKRSDC